MTRRSSAIRRPTRFVPWSFAVLLVSLLAVAAIPVPRAAAQQRRVVVIGDSIILGAESALVGAFQGAGWQIAFDAQVSRSTVAALDAIEAHRGELTDSLVLSFGANDAGNPATFRSRVERVLAATASVPNVYWLTIREVRDYYPAANQVLRDVAANHPNVTVVDWHGATAGTTGMTSGDGLHLTGAGAARMAEVIVGAVVNGVAPIAAAPPPPPPPPPPTAPPVVAAAPPTTAAPTTAATTTAAPATTTTEAPATSTTTTEALDDERDAQDERATELAEIEDTSTIDVGDAIGWTAAGGLGLVLVLVLGWGLGLGAWSLASTRGRGRADEGIVPSPQHPAVRSQQRAERIASAANAAHARPAGDVAVAEPGDPSGGSEPPSPPPRPPSGP